MLDERKQLILQAIIRDYVETVEPVGSENLAQRYSSWGVKSATIRNAMADLSDKGYLRQPHTSAGRIPSDMGYRFYVDHLMDSEDPVETAAYKPRREMELEKAATLERILRQTCSLLTQMTHYTSVATPPRPADTLLRQVFAAAVGPDTLLVVALLSTGDTENRLHTVPAAKQATKHPEALTQAVNAINAAWSGQALSELDDKDKSQPPTLPTELSRALYRSIADAVIHIVVDASTEQRVVVEGAGEILKQPEFQDVAKLENVLGALQSRAHVFQVLAQDCCDAQVTVVIGTENFIEAMQECTVVTAPYYVGVRERGTLGVVGPTRMNYDRTLPAVSYMARSLSHVLSKLA